MDMAGAPTGGPSLTFQLLLYCSCGWCSAWFVMTVSLLVYKGLQLHFPPAALPMEIISSLLVLSVDAAALTLGMRGNLMEEAGTTCLSLVLLLLVAMGAIYYMWLQTYVMTLDLVFSATLISFNVLAILTGLHSVHGFMHARRAPRRRFAPPPPPPPPPDLSDFLSGDGKRQKGD